jgi:hypothetical protein
LRSSISDHLGNAAAVAASSAPPKVTTQDPGALSILEFPKTPPGFAQAASALAAALDPSRQDKTTVLAGLADMVDQRQELRAQIERVTCKTPNGRTGQRLAAYSLLKGEEALGYAQAGLMTAVPGKLKADLTQAMRLAQAGETAGEQAVKWLSK